MTEFLHEVVNRREAEGFWNNIPVVPQARINEEATERLVQWLIDQQREEDDANV